MSEVHGGRQTYANERELKCPRMHREREILMVCTHARSTTRRTRADATQSLEGAWSEDSNAMKVFREKDGSAAPVPVLESGPRSS